MPIFKVIGTVVEALPIKEGDSANGHWTSQDFVIKNENVVNGVVYSNDYCFNIFNNKVQIPNINSRVEVSFEPSCRKGKTGGYFTNLRAISWQYVGQDGKPIQQTAQVQAQQPVSQVAPQGPIQAPAQPAPTGGDDLPF